MPKAPATFSQEDEEEKTTIESGWEEEASTTVEQGDVAEKLRSMNGIPTPVGPGPRNITNVTSTNGGALDEPTVDDQRANAALSLITPSVAPARIVVTAGNDKGQELEIRPGKTYTIGRAIDNDFVLTDIAVSRKHFDLRHENGKWIVVDRGSGNGTVINGNIEDQPFVLMNGDAIEIGNTTFRFDHANQPSRTRDVGYTDVDEEEPSTVAGKPLRDPETPARELPPLPRPKTVPPPAPLPRPRSPSAAPGPVGYAGLNGARGSIPPVPSAAPIGQPVHQAMPMGGPIGVPMASPTAPTVSPLQQMPAMRPPHMLDQNGVVRPQMLHNNAHAQPPLPNVMPTTIPGQGPPVAPSQPQVLPFGYPNVGDMQPQLHGLQINGHVPRDATSTALVQPQPYGMGMAQATYGVAQPQPGLSKRIKMLLGGALLMVLAAIATILIIKSASSSEKPKPTKSVESKTKESAAEPTKKGPVVVTKPDDKVDPTKVEEQKKLEAKKAEDAKKAEEQKRLDDKKTAEEQKKLEAKKAEDAKKAEEQKRLDDKKAAEEQRKLEAKKLDEQKKAEEQRRAEERRAEEQKRLEAKKAEDAQRKAEEQRRAEERRAEERRKAEEARKKKLEKRNTKTTTEVASNTTTTNTTTTNTTTTSTTKKPPADTGEVKDRAEQLYRSKKFNDAAKTLRSAAEKLDEADARDLRSIAAVYEQVGKAYNVGMGPATPPVEAYTSLERALNLDRPIGVFSDEIKTKLAAIAPKAAAKFMVDKNYEAAFKAVRVAETNGGGNSTTQAVRSGLVDVANDLYTAAMSEKDSNPGGARAKLQRIRAIVDAKTPVVAKAEKALRDLPK